MERMRAIGAGALIVVVIVAGSACGGRTQLVPAYQIGRLSTDAVVAEDSGVRVVVRTAAWPGPPMETRVIPVEITFDNNSSRDIEIRRQHVTLLTPAGERLSPLDPAAIAQAVSTRDAIGQEALVEGVLGSSRRVSGFVYFNEPDADNVGLRIDLIGSPNHEPFGEIVIPFAVE